MKRRHFIRNTATGIVLPTVLNGFGVKSLGMNSLVEALSMAPDDDLVMVMIYLAGGNDGLNTLIPLEKIDGLNAVRPHVALDESDVINLGNTDYGLHPSMEGMKSLYEEDRLAIIQNVGYPEQNYSHFRSTDIWISGSDADEVISSGWAGRFVKEEHPDFPDSYPTEEYPDPLAIEIGYSSSLMFQGPQDYMGYVIQDPDSFYEFINETDHPSPSTRAGERLDYVKLISDQSQVYGQVVQNAALVGTNAVEYPDDNQLAQQLKICARLIKGGMKTKLYLVELSGFDTHDNQVQDGDHTAGEHAELLRTLSDAVRLFMDDCDALEISDRVLGMTFSEFGRRVNSNASNGTDHGSAAPMFLFGNKVKGGIIGNAPEFPMNVDWEFNLDMEYDFRQIYSSVLQEYFCLESDKTSDILYGDFDKLDLFQGTDCTSITSTTEPVYSNDIKLFPNPSSDVIQIETAISKGNVEMIMYDAIGRKVMELFRGYHSQVVFKRSFNISSLPKGAYFIKVKMNHGNKNLKFIKQ